MKLLVGAKEGCSSREWMAVSFQLGVHGRCALGCAFACCWRGEERARVWGGVGERLRVAWPFHHMRRGQGTRHRRLALVGALPGMAATQANRRACGGRRCDQGGRRFWAASGPSFVTPLGVKHAFISQNHEHYISYMFIIACNISWH
jgi:hypothetical protein